MLSRSGAEGGVDVAIVRNVSYLQHKSDVNIVLY